MKVPTTLATLLHIAESKVAKLESEYSLARARAARTQNGPAISEAIIIECKLDRAKSRLASVRMALKREGREQMIAANLLTAV